ncbi:hypothetical protein RI138_14835 [Streptomyces sp. C11-1]|uniref:3-oxoacyl-ACP synthase n=1 Tax=Streptomyces durocortorensis TaxID=2811104 RepID=A0ABY9VVN4_9ACTN|nr:hypothetical protein [Streptomyces durocortorensis]WNF28001.1 hypothetical protein RI138_14835 [Streptomyces durocortorensis]
MYRTVAPPVAARGVPAPPLRLERVVHRAFPAGRNRIDDAFSERHFTDLTTQYGVEYRPGLVPGGTGNTFAAMSRELVESLDLDGDPVGVAIVAHCTPDLDCRYAAATYLSEAWPHSPLAFGVSEQGSCTPFVALRLATEFARRHALGRALVLVLDQAALPYDTGLVGDQALRGDAGVALLLSTGDGPGEGRGVRPDLRHTPGVSTEDVRALLAEQLSPYGRDITVVAGSGIDPGRDLPDGLAEVRGAAKGFPCSALWAELAGPAGPRPLVLVEHDPTTGDLGVCVAGDAP